jgi:crossover junction endodeoxyribonuclease RusA
MTRIVFPWPDKAITPHAKGGWHNKARATKRQRIDACWIAKAAKVERDPTAILRVEYSPPNAARRDAQNMPARIKGLIDGIADAMGCDDNGFRVRYPDQFGAPTKGGAIIVIIGESNA